MLRNSPARYGAVSMTFHWVMAVLIVGLLCLGLYMSGLESLGDKIKPYALHKSFGIVVLALVTLRAGWHLFVSRPPGMEPSMPRFERFAARAAHLLLYAGMLAMPLSGWMMSSAQGWTVSVFGLFDLPALGPADDRLSGLLHTVHELGGYCLIALVALHAAAALKHHFIDRDGVLRRMLPFLPALALFVALPAAAQEALVQWEEMRDGTVLTFRQDDRTPLPVLSYKVNAAFEPDALETSQITLAMDLSDAFFAPETLDRPDLQSAFEFGQALGGAKRAGPGSAVFTSTKLEKTGAGTFDMHGDLGINGITQPVIIPVSISVNSYFDLPKMDFKGSMRFNPRHYGSVTLEPPPGVAWITVDFSFALIPGA